MARSKVIVVHADDPEMEHIHSIQDVAPHTLKEIRNFFEVYKELEGKNVEVQGFFGKKEALQVVQESIALYNKHKTELRAQ